MNLQEIDTNFLKKLACQQKEQVTCSECCQYYVAPSTAACGHSLCNRCWYGRQKCHICTQPMERRNVQLNLPLQSRAEHINILVQAFEAMFNIKLDEFESLSKEQKEEDSNKNVKDWLADSQNRFSGSMVTQSTQDLNPHVEYLTSTVQIHASKAKTNHLDKVTHVPLPQDDWDKIELLPDTEDCMAKSQHNIIGPMDIEPFNIDENEYSMEKPRRSTRNKETNSSIKDSLNNDVQNVKDNATTTTAIISQPTKKMKQTWNNVKKMKKEFSKLNKENRNKLNVSIEMCKKAQESNNNIKLTDKEIFTPNIIPDITSCALDKGKEIEQIKIMNTHNGLSGVDSGTVITNNCHLLNKKTLNTASEYNPSGDIIEPTCPKPTEKSRVKFFKKSPLQANPKEKLMAFDHTDDIEISIKIGKTITNFFIKKNENDIQVKIKTDRGVQTSLESEKNCYQSAKRDRTLDHEDELSLKKKRRLNNNNVSGQNTDNIIQNSSRMVVNDSECNNYDLVMENVFAHIDADIEMIQKDKGTSPKSFNNTRNTVKSQTYLNNSSSQQNVHVKEIESDNQQDSENIFTNFENDVNCHSKKINSGMSKAHENIESLTPNLVQELTSAYHEDKVTENIEMLKLGTPINENSSDVSIVEETPQKNVSNMKVKQKSDTSCLINDVPKQMKSISNGDRESKSVVELSSIENVSYKRSTESTFNENKAKQSLDTPLNIKKFVQELTYKSTPMARKSLNFTRETRKGDPEETLCPSANAIQTTQEKEFLKEIFEHDRSSPVCKTMLTRVTHDRFCVAGSCLQASEVAQLKRLCSERGWRFVDVYTKDLTHLVVSVDDDNRSNRSVKYLCALAAGKWIVSYAWLKKCIATGTAAPEEPFEAVDTTGEPGPRRSRLAARQLFQGITFYCQPPFSVLDLDTLKEILETAGGRVVSEVKEVRVVEDEPALLLAEPEDTQDIKFTYLAMDLKIVPVNIEWALNCLGSYTLGPIHELLLCPSSLLPAATKTWPAVLLACDLD